MALDAQTIAAAKAYRQQLNAQGIRYGQADRMVDAKFGPGTAAVINPHKVGGFAKVGGAVGDVGKKIAPLAALIPGVGPVAAAGLTAGAATLGKLNDPGGLGGTKVLKEIGLPAAATYVGGKLAQGGIGKVGTDMAEGAITGGSGGSNLLGDVLGWAKNNPELIMGGLSAIQGMRQQGKANDLQSEAINMARQRYNDAAPIRSAINSRLLAGPQAAPDFGTMFADEGNPYDVRKRSILQQALR